MRRSTFFDNEDGNLTPYERVLSQVVSRAADVADSCLHLVRTEVRLQTYAQLHLCRGRRYHWAHAPEQRRIRKEHPTPEPFVGALVDFYTLVEEHVVPCLPDASCALVVAHLPALCSQLLLQGVTHAKGAQICRLGAKQLTCNAETLRNAWACCARMASCGTRSDGREHGVSVAATAGTRSVAEGSLLGDANEWAVDGMDNLSDLVSSLHTQQAVQPFMALATGSDFCGVFDAVDDATAHFELVLRAIELMDMPYGWGLAALEGWGGTDKHLGSALKRRMAGVVLRALKLDKNYDVPVSQWGPVFDAEMLQQCCAVPAVASSGTLATEATIAVTADAPRQNRRARQYSEPLESAESNGSKAEFEI